MLSGDAMMRPSLERYALDLAQAASGRSEDPHRKVGAAILGPLGEVLAMGYNGPPSGVDLTHDQWADRDFVRLVIIHAEQNALRYVRPGEGALLASTLRPCLDCLKAARAQGIRRVVYLNTPSEYWTIPDNVVGLLQIAVKQWSPDA